MFSCKVSRFKELVQWCVGKVHGPVELERDSHLVRWKDSHGQS